MKKKAKVALFKKYTQEAINCLGQHDKQFEISGIKTATYRACCKWHSLETYPDGDPRQIDIIYNKEWLFDKDTNKKDIRKVAYHEILESMFSKLRDFGVNTDLTISSREVDSEIHKFIRIFENKILPFIKE